jgi:hypothetical protein
MEIVVASKYPFYLHPDIASLARAGFFRGEDGALELHRDTKNGQSPEEYLLPSAWLAEQYATWLKSTGHPLRAAFWFLKAKDIASQFLSVTKNCSLSLDEIQVLVRTSHDQTKLDQLARLADERTKKAPGHRLRLQVFATRLWYRRFATTIIQPLSYPENDFPTEFGTHDLETRIWAYRSYAQAAKLRFSVRNDHLLIFALLEHAQYLAEMDHEYGIENIFLKNVCQFELARAQSHFKSGGRLEDNETYQRWRMKLRASGQALPYPSSG